MCYMYVGRRGRRQWLREEKQVSLIRTVYLLSHRKKNLNLLVSSLGVSSGREADTFLAKSQGRPQHRLQRVCRAECSQHLLVFVWTFCKQPRERSLTSQVSDEKPLDTRLLEMLRSSKEGLAF